MSELYDHLPAPIQLAIALGLAFAIAFVWVLGRKSTAGDRGDEEEIRKLQERLLDERLKGLESDLRLVIAAERVGLMNEVKLMCGEMTMRLNDLSVRIDKVAVRIRHE